MQDKVTASVSRIDVNDLDSREAEFAIPAHKLEDPLQFDMSKILVFKMPEIVSIKMYDEVDEAAPDVPFKDSKYFKDAHYLRGFMDKKGLKKLEKKIRGLDDHNRD